jgi:hypothetical protein
MLVLPKQLPIDVPVNGLATPAAVMSIKSVLVSVTVAAVILTGLPKVTDLSSTLFIAELPLQINAPVHTRPPLPVPGVTENESVLTAVPVLVMLANVIIDPAPPCDISALPELLKTNDVPL